MPPVARLLRLVETCGVVACLFPRSEVRQNLVGTFAGEIASRRDSITTTAAATGWATGSAPSFIIPQTDILPATTSPRKQAVAVSSNRPLPVWSPFAVALQFSADREVACRRT